MNKSYRINLDPSANDNVEIKIKLEQNVETLEFLTMSIDTKDMYGSFNADYGVLVGRVIANGGVGVVNAKISIFIPLSEEDERNRDIVSIYPYKSPSNLNSNGKRYNLLPRVAQRDLNTNLISPKQPFGSFPIKPEVVTNPKLMDVHKKYYKYTATTNNAGDYMIFGVPVGVQTVHMSVDITDIGEYSMNPAAMVNNLGYSSNLFTDNNTRIKGSNRLDDLPHIETQEISVNIIPFWGDVENFEIGITQQNFRIRATLVNTFTIFGSVFTDGENSMWGAEYGGGLGDRTVRELFRARDDANATIGMVSKRIGIVSEKIYYYPSHISDDDIDDDRVDPTTEMMILSKNEYSSYKRNGDFVFIINCNRNRVFRNEFNDEIPIPHDSDVGIFTKFRGFLVIEYTNDDVPMQFTGSIGDNTTLVPFRYRLKFPQFANPGESFNQNEVVTVNTDAWRRQSYTFEYNKFYSLSKFHGLTFNYSNSSDINWEHNQGFFHDTNVNQIQRDPFNNVGIIQTNNHQLISDSVYQYPNGQYEFPSNGGYQDRRFFGANWMNLSIHLPQLSYLHAGFSFFEDARTVDHFTIQRRYEKEYNQFYVYDNQQVIAAHDRNTRFMPRSDFNWTDIIEVPIVDIVTMRSIVTKGFTSSGITLSGIYRNGVIVPSNGGWPSACPFRGGRENGNQDSLNIDSRTYFYKGFDTANCIDYLFELGIIVDNVE